MPSDEIGFLEKNSGALNALQLVAGVVSLILYVIVTTAQQRFFPFTASTVAGTLEVEFERKAYNEMQMVNGFANVLSSLLFLGKDTFCVSKTVYINLKPAHQICYDWRWGVLGSILLAGIGAFLSLIGAALAGIEMGTVLGAGDCVPLLEMELQCNGQLPSDVAKREAAQIRIEDLGALSCIEQTVKSTIALSYFVWYLVCFVLSSIGFQSARVYLHEQG